MEISATVHYRKVRNIRLEYGLDGLIVVLPVGYQGSVAAIIEKHKQWIARRALYISRVRNAAAELQIHNRTEQQLRHEIRRYLLDSFEYIKIMPKQVKYREMHTRWGSCTAEGVITFSTKLKKLPDNLVAYIVHHEMTHLQVMRHNKTFWEYMAQKFPDYKECEKQLKVYSVLLGKK